MRTVDIFDTAHKINLCLQVAATVLLSGALRPRAGERVMYSLQVYFHGEATPQVTAYEQDAGKLLQRVPELLAEHVGCERVVVMMGATRLFSIDCEGNRQS